MPGPFDLIADHLDGHTLFVFPTEIVKRSWQRAVLERLEAAALRADRFVSWDDFSTCFMDPERRERPVSRVLRSAFVQQFLAGNAEKAELRRLLPAAHSGTWTGFSAFFLSLLPRLVELRAGLAGQSGQAELLADLGLLHQAYLRFLSARELFEPAFQTPGPPGLDRNALIFFPKLILDFHRYEAAVAACPRIHKVEPDRMEGSPPPRILRFDGWAAEWKALFLELDRLLAGGCSPDDILVSVGDIQPYESVIRELGLAHELPVSVRPGRPLADTRGADIFRLIGDCASAGFHAEAVKRLLLDPAYPWKSPAENRELAAFGVNRGVLGLRREHGRQIDEWRSAQPDRHSPADGLARIRRRSELLSRGAGALVGAAGFEALKRAVMAFAGDWFTLPGWQGEAHSAYRLALSVLEECVQAERAGLLPKLQPWRFWLGQLAERMYIPVGCSGAVRFHEYRAAAGSLPRLHFLVNATRSASSVREDPGRGLGDQVRTALERAGRPPRDASDDFLEAYLRSGDQVCISFADQARDGPALPPSLLIEYELTPVPGEAGPGSEDLLKTERAFWAGGPAPTRLYRHQKTGLAALAATGLAGKGGDFTRQRVEAAGLRDGLAGRLCKDGRTTWSDSRLRKYLDCPFAFLFSELLAVRPAAFSICWSPHLAAGSVIHHVLEKLFDEAPPDAGLDEHTREEYLRRCEELLVRDLERFAPSDPAPPRLVLQIRRMRMLQSLQTFIDWYARERAGFRLVASEKSRSRPLDESTSINGRVDHVARRGEGLFILDFKSGRLPGKREILGEADSMRVFQIPFYAFLMQPEGRIESAGYYSLEQAKYSEVIGGSADARSNAIPPAGADAFIARALEAARAASAAVRRGEYRAAADCRGCELRGVCRVKFNISRPGGGT